MKPSHYFLAAIDFIWGKRISTNSLQFRLTLELLTISILGLGSVAVWAGWQMEQNLVAAHKQTLEYIAMRFPEQFEVYSQEKSLEIGLKRTIKRVSTPGLVIWVETSHGQLLAQSADVDSFLSEIEAGVIKSDGLHQGRSPNPLHPV
jgi:hypothetical protein